MQNQPIINYQSMAIRQSVATLVICLPLTLTACNQSTTQSSPQATDAKASHTEHDEHEQHSHDQHSHEQHSDDEHSHHHDQHSHDADHHDAHQHDEHHEHHEHGGEHQHAHHHHHGTGAKQVIPEGYTVNFAVSNHPLFLLSEAVTEGTPTTVRKLLGAGDVGHHGSLSPSDMKTVEDSKYVVWFGKALESNLENTLTKAPNVVTILDDKNISTLTRRDLKAMPITDSLDPHVWLDPSNAKVIVAKLTELHSQANPEYAESYQANAKKFATELDKVVDEQRQKRADSKQYWGSHDAFQYLEKSMNVKLAGTLTTDHEIPTKASQILWLNKNRPYEIMCLLAQSEPKEGIKNKLKPVTAKVLVEDMSDSNTYLQAWKHSAEVVTACVNE